ncbi:superoxide dismutase [Oceanobacillus arenosus]|uniref:Superoxide dismutase n=1 Tax=Oceanobacillus arenosus TaxID=1229153 RepID=A0A3D8PRI2_9BACI|nr:superoxide dismutase family protein [Oceanobacillus arenosus]RDW18723.1 superoxide dismutase [Oceanobacillus arenosus]
MRFICFCCFIFLVACQGTSPSIKEVEMYNTSGDMVGTATLNEQPDGIKIHVKLDGLEPGFHGIHVHEFPKCEAPDFSSAGGHLNPEGKEHGLMRPDGAHLGDLPNVEADGDGVVDAELMLAGATMKEGNKSILRGEGTSLIVSEKQDDGVSQPSGNSGTRIICGKITTDSKTDTGESPSDPTETNKEKAE